LLTGASCPCAMGYLSERADVGFVTEDAPAGNMPSVAVRGDHGYTLPPSVCYSRVLGHRAERFGPSFASSHRVLRKLQGSPGNSHLTLANCSFYVLVVDAFGSRDEPCHEVLLVPPTAHCVDPLL
jgi:hypothetical protein